MRRRRPRPRPGRLLRTSLWAARSALAVCSSRPALSGSVAGAPRRITRVRGSVRVSLPPAVARSVWVHVIAFKKEFRLEEACQASRIGSAAQLPVPTNPTEPSCSRAHRRPGVQLPALAEPGDSAVQCSAAGHSVTSPPGRSGACRAGSAPPRGSRRATPPRAAHAEYCRLAPPGPPRRPDRRESC
jgi:hypothetical protein